MVPENLIADGIEISPLDDTALEEGLITTLENLSPVGPLGIMHARRILDEMGSSNGTYRIFVAREEDHVVGTVTLLIEHKLIHNGGLVGHIEDVAVRKGWQRRGIGRKLVAHAVEEAKKNGCYKIVLDCAEHNIPFYKSLGFRVHETSMRLDLPPHL